MIVTEEEALKLECVTVRQAGGYYCVSSKCMAWTWVDNKLEHVPHLGICEVIFWKDGNPPQERRGKCGLCHP